jgi:hypothetical protein
MLKFKGFGGFLLERIDFYILEHCVISMVGMLNNLLGKEWGEEAQRRLLAA